jgi:hypothetical protein
MCVCSGQNFGPTGASFSVAVTYFYIEAGTQTLRGTFLATGCSVLTAHTQLQCTTAQGYGSRLFFRADIAGVIGTQSSSSLAAYSGPTISTATTPTGLLNPNGGNRVTFTGNHFGPADRTPAGTSVSYSISIGPGRTWSETGTCTSSTAHTVIVCDGFPGVCIFFVCPFSPRTIHVHAQVAFLFVCPLDRLALQWPLSSTSGARHLCRTPPHWPTLSPSSPACPAVVHSTRGEARPLHCLARRWALLRIVPSTRSPTEVTPVQSFRPLLHHVPRCWLRGRLASARFALPWLA